MRSIYFKIWTLCCLWVATAGFVCAQTIDPDVTISRGAVHRFKATINDPMFTYEWKLKTLEGQKMNYTFKSTAVQSELIYFDKEGTYELSVTPTQKGNGCPGEPTIMVIKVGIVLESRFIAAHQDRHGNGFLGSCDETISLDGTKSTGERLTYEWGPKDHFDNPYIASATFNKNGVTSNTTVWLEVTDKFGSTHRTEKEIIFDPTPRAIVQGVSEISFDSWVTLDGSNSIGKSNVYYWSNKDPDAQDYGHVDNTDPSKMIVRKAGTYILKVMDRNGCTNSTEFAVNYNGTAPITQEDVGITKERVHVDIRVLRNDYDLENDMDTLSLKVFTNPLHGTAELVSKGLIKYTPDETYLGEDQFEYEICDSQGHCSTEFVKILVRAGVLKVIRGFSPNGDGINDRFEIKAIKMCKESEIHIYNRWGDLVYKNIRYGLDGETSWWDGIATEGMNNGNAVTSGTYYYILKTDSYPTKKGYIYLSK
ncbi:gliding motility-associated C-terminal domain-containing protein [Halosquirtibacter xylanolyticus]|uniref:T9SS type B sorting domain-containing protein n=1 Tax=Halosquirtibacter xylanolyticus TaxID=3374599 RepID=UPI0037498753|nr:gliding motility-associated C-terminal domain-containing protein [Prolixibacteraceae bacterium]